MTPFNHNKQQGFSLTELMIALTISLILIFGIISIYISSKRGYALQDGMSRQQENARASLDVLLRDLRMAGYPKTNTAIEFIVPASTTDGGGTPSDSITVQYESATDCLGQATPANSCGTKNCAINRYFINADNLWCQGNGSTDSEVIAEDITNMQILYGIDTDVVPDDLANKYTSWSNVTVAERAKIVGVRIGFLSITPTDSAGAANTNTYAVLDQDISVTDKRIHRVYVSTVGLRNRLQ